jgi:hypothetical protein
MSFSTGPKHTPVTVTITNHFPTFAKLLLTPFSGITMFVCVYQYFVIQFS